MAEDDGEAARAAAQAAAAADGIALAGASRAAADAYLAEQLRLARLQAESLIEQNAFELSHLRWRRFNDQMKGALQIMIVALGLAIVIGLVVAVWRASQADGLVVEALSVPPALLQNGMAGDVVAGDLTGKIAAIRDLAVAASLSASKDVRQDQDNEIKVEIPETGISLAQAWRYLRLWFGHERPLNGNVRVAADGKAVLTLTLERRTFTARGPLADLDALEQQVAEQVFAATDPGNYVLYLEAVNRNADAYAAAGLAVTEVSGAQDRAGAYALWANATHFVVGDNLLSLARARISIGIYPKSSAGHMEAMSNLLDLGHDEAALAQARIAGTMRQQDEGAAFRETGFPYAMEYTRYTRLLETGDFAQALAVPCDWACSPASLAARRADYAARTHDIGAGRALLVQAAAMVQPSPLHIARAQYDLAMEAMDGPAAAAAARAYAAAVKITAGPARLIAQRNRTVVLPMLAVALAHAGDFAGAEAAVAATPLDCYDCLRARAAVAALKGDSRGAAGWFARAVAAAPSIPFAYAEWGAMLLRKGDVAGAITMFSRAHDKGPNFADPLELWGEALIAANRSDLALAKFEEAARHAPNWGRLHLKWGEALLWLGRKDDARKQFALASGLGLGDAERLQLERVAAIR